MTAHSHVKLLDRIRRLAPLINVLNEITFLYRPRADRDNDNLVSCFPPYVRNHTELSILYDRSGFLYAFNDRNIRSEKIL